MKTKLFALVGAGLAIVATAVQSTYASVYTLSSTGVTDIGGAASDTATSIFGSLGDLLPVMIPLIVIGFVIGLVRSFISKRG